MSNDKSSSVSDRCLYYITFIAVFILGAVAFTLIIKYELTIYTVIVLIFVVGMIPILILILRDTKRSTLNIKLSFGGILPCRKGFIHKTDTKIEICHRCVPFHFSIWSIIAYLIASPKINDQFVWNPFYKLILTSLGDFGYLLLTTLFLFSIPIEASITILLHKESSNIRRWITSLLTTVGIVLGIAYFVETAPIWQQALNHLVG